MLQYDFETRIVLKQLQRVGYEAIQFVCGEIVEVLFCSLDRSHTSSTHTLGLVCKNNGLLYTYRLETGIARQQLPVPVGSIILPMGPHNVTPATLTREEGVHNA